MHEIKGAVKEDVRRELENLYLKVTKAFADAVLKNQTYMTLSQVSELQALFQEVSILWPSDQDVQSMASQLGLYLHKLKRCCASVEVIGLAESILPWLKEDIVDTQKVMEALERMQAVCMG
eukprot:5100996-Amphidinium_carterae.1